MTTFTTSVPFPPSTLTVVQNASSLTSGTINHVSCGGAVDAEIHDAAGNVLATFKANAAATFPVSLPFSGGSPVVVQRSPSDITLTY